jgi:hypothetical protein
LLKSFGLPGVQPGAMSAPFPPPADSYARGVLFHVIDAAIGDCTTNLMGSQEEYLFLGDDSVFAYRGDSIQVDQGKVAAPTPGRDFVVAIQADTWAERTVTFLPPGRVEVPIYGFPSGGLLDATGTGTIVTQGKLGTTTPDVSRPFKPKAGGSAVLFITANKPSSATWTRHRRAGSPCGATPRALPEARVHDSPGGERHRYGGAGGAFASSNRSCSSTPSSLALSSGRSASRRRRRRTPAMGPKSTAMHGAMTTASTTTPVNHPRCGFHPALPDKM